MLRSMDGFMNAMRVAGLATRDTIMADGRLYRFRVGDDKAGNRNGWYVLYVDGIAAGAFGSWRTGETFKWCAKSETTMTEAEREAFRRRMEEARQARESEGAARKKEAADKALTIWKAARPAPDTHPYLVRKGVRSHGLRLHNGALVVPLRDGAGVLHSLQFIDGDGGKRFLSGGRMQGCYHSIGVLTETLCIAEGYATGASIYEAAGHAVAVAFNCGNLLAAARVLRQKYPALKIIICADNDTQTDGNPGLTKAREAAAAIGGFLAVPPCNGDFNDLYVGGAQ